MILWKTIARLLTGTCSMIYKPLSISIIITLLYLLSLPSLYAYTTMSSNTYKLKMGNFDTFAGKSSNSNYKAGITGGELGPGLYSGTNYKVRAGFQYINSIIPFQFSVSSQFVNFSTLTPGTPLTRTHTLTISNGSANGYVVTAYEDHPMRLFNYGINIPDTTCDSGSCSETTAALWNNPLTYGFGYRCDDITGTNCPSAFSTSNYYKQFADAEKSENPQVVMSGSNVGRNFKSQITYKINIASTQQAGLYQNIITYIATPTY